MRSGNLKMRPLFQIDANINPGNSGGPLLERPRRSDRNCCFEDQCDATGENDGRHPGAHQFCNSDRRSSFDDPDSLSGGFTPSHRTASLRDQEIFAQSKDATVLILAPKKVQTAATGRSQSPQNEPPSEIFDRARIRNRCR